MKTHPISLSHRETLTLTNSLNGQRTSPATSSSIRSSGPGKPGTTTLKWTPTQNNRSMETILLLTLFFCHFLADYTHLSTAWMLSAKRLGSPIAPIWFHAKVHAALMAIAILPFTGFTSTWAWSVIFQQITHFLIDVWKGRMNGWFPSLQNPANKWHWIVFGFDQYLHAVVIILMVHLLSK